MMGSIYIQEKRWLERGMRGDMSHRLALFRISSALGFPGILLPLQPVLAWLLEGQASGF